MALQRNQDQQEALTEAFRYLEQALSNSQAGFLTQALTEARSQYYQSFFKDDLDEQKLNRLVKILKGTDQASNDEKELLKTAIIDIYGEFNIDSDRLFKIILPAKIDIIKESHWYKTLVEFLIMDAQSQTASNSRSQGLGSSEVSQDVIDFNKMLDTWLGLSAVFMDTSINVDL